MWNNIRKRLSDSDVICKLKWSIISVAFLQGGNFLSSIVIARLVGKLNFGLYGAIIGTATMIIGVAGAGLSISATKFIAEAKKYGVDRLGRIMAACQAITFTTAFLYSVLLFFFSDLISRVYLQNANHRVYLLFSVPYIFFMVMNLYQVGVLQGYMNFKRIASLNAVNFLINISLIYVLGSLFLIKGIFIAIGTSAFVNCLLYKYYVSKYLSADGILFRYKEMLKELPLLKSFFLPAILSGLLGSVGPWLANKFLIESSYGYYEMAIFTAAVSYKSVVTLIPSLITRVYSPLICKSRVECIDQYKRYVKQLFIVSCLIAISLSVVIVALSPYLMGFFGNDFIIGYGLLVLLCASGIIDTFVACCYQILYSYGIMKYQFYISLFWSIFLILGSYLFSYEYGAIGMGIAYLLASLSSVLFYVILFIYKKQSVVC